MLRCRTHRCTGCTVSRLPRPILTCTSNRHLSLETARDTSRQMSTSLRVPPRKTSDSTLWSRARGIRDHGCLSCPISGPEGSSFRVCPEAASCSSPTTPSSPFAGLPAPKPAPSSPCKCKVLSLIAGTGGKKKNQKLLTMAYEALQKSPLPLPL